MPYKDKHNPKYMEYRRQWARQKYHNARELHKERGICLNIACTNSKSENSVYCLFHLDLSNRRAKKTRSKPSVREYNKVAKKIKYYKRKSENKCVNCGMPLSEESRAGIKCINCYNSCEKTNY